MTKEDEKNDRGEKTKDIGRSVSEEEIIDAVAAEVVQGEVIDRFLKEKKLFPEIQDKIIKWAIIRGFPEEEWAGAKQALREVDFIIEEEKKKE